MSQLRFLASLLPVLLLLGPALGEEGSPGEQIEWEKNIPAALAKAKAEGKILMICVNAQYVDGRPTEEPAAKGLREVVYKDSRIVAKSRDFVCVMTSPKSGAIDHGELRGLGIDGEIISPQHIFVNPAGDRVLLRKEYWSHGKGEKAVEELLALMKTAEEKAGTPATDPEPSPEGDGPAPEGVSPAPEGEGRAEWIASMLAKLEGGAAERDAALKALVKSDKDGDCTGPLIELLSEQRKNVDLLRALIRALGRNGLEAAALPISDFLTHKDDSIRANAAVSLEYIGSHDRKIVTALMEAAGKQKDESIANHVYRALGRCGNKDARARALLLKMVAAGRSEFATLGPTIGLAYFEDDEKARRGVEKLLQQMGVPGGGRRGGGQNTLKRAVLSWTLACIGDKKSAAFVRQELMEKLKNVKAFWVDGMLEFWDSVAWACDGDEGALAAVEGGVRFTVGVAKRWGSGLDQLGTSGLMDDARNGRDRSDFEPMGDNLLGTGRGG